MLPFFRAPLLAALFSCVPALAAQTYTPKSIRLEGANSLDQAQISQLVKLKAGEPISKAEIEAAMQRLADSGLFADLTYTVDNTALVFLLKPIAQEQARPVRYANFVWWQPGQLEPLVEARVPLFHGTLPLTGQLTAQVEDALVALLAEKGITHAHVEAMQSAQGSPSTSLQITQPEITLGQVKISGVPPEAAEQMRNVTNRLAGREFDSGESPATIVANTIDTHRNAGYLDVVVDPPAFSPPHTAAQGYAVDASDLVHPGALYHVGAITYSGVEPQFTSEIRKVAGVQPGDPAQEMTLHIAQGLTERFYQNRGMLAAKAPVKVSKDAATHTAAYQFDVVPGPVYTYASVDLAALAPDVQARVQATFHAHPGQVADLALQTQLLQALNAAGVHKVAFERKLNDAEHTVVYGVRVPSQAR